MTAMSEKQADAVAQIALEMPEQPTTRAVLTALAAAYKRGWNEALNQSAADLAISLARAERKKEPA